MGLIYEQGRGVEKDQKKAIEYFTKGAEQGEKDCKIKLTKLQQGARG